MECIWKNLSTCALLCNFVQYKDVYTFLYHFDKKQNTYLHFAIKCLCFAFRTVIYNVLYFTYT